MFLTGISLALIFLIVALLYASVGFGGGSTYIAILALTNISFETIPILALICNIIVVTGNSLRFKSNNLIPWRRIWPLLLFSVPAAWLGGFTVISRENFIFLLGVLLILAALILLVRSWLDRKIEIEKIREYSHFQTFILCAVMGTFIGYVSGLVGIGGGIFLAPILLLIKWTKPREIAATASIFILVNSIAGLTGQFGKYDYIVIQDIISPHILLFIAVLIGGQLGSFLVLKILSESIIRNLTAILTLYIGLRLIWLG